jgi:phosphoribosylformylglycinamidine cyclo-ligase
MYRTFNCGVGMVVCVPAEEADKTLARLQELGEEAFIVGSIEAGNNGEAVELAGL